MRRKRLPRPTALGWRLGLGAAAVAAALGVAALARAEETEVPRYTPSDRGGRAAVVDLAERHFAPEWVGWAVRVAGCESSFDLWARSSGWDRRYGWYEHVGPWQVSVPTWGATARELFGGSLYDPEVSAAMAAWILDRQGTGAWPYCSRRSW